MATAAIFFETMVTFLPYSLKMTFMAASSTPVTMRPT